MPWFEFVCPHCSRQFGLENPPAGGQIACPDCEQSLAIPAELPLPSNPMGAAEEAQAEASDVGSLDFIRPTLSMESHRTLKSPAAPPVENQPPVPPVASPEALPKPPVVRQLTRQEKEARRQRRSLVLMVGGLILLIATLIVLSRL